MAFLLLGLLACVGAFDLRSQEYGHMEYQEGGDNFGRHDQDWGYKYENGPNTWRAMYPRCTGYKQSPVALPSKPHHVVHAKPVTYKNLNIPQPALLRNTGTALEIVLKGDKLPTNAGIYKNERTRYKLFKVVIHWGKENTRGAEHSIGGEQFCAEIQALQYNDKYKSPEEALGRPGGILSTSTLLKVSKKSSSAKWEKLLAKLPECSGTSKPVEVELDADFFMNGHDYYMYEGSLTTPPCSENVVHQVFTDVLSISEYALEALRRVKNEKGEDVCDNFRPIQPLNKRKVTLVKETGHADQYEQDDNEWFMDDHYGQRDYNRNHRFMGDHSGNERFMDDHSGRRDYHRNDRFMDDHSERRDYHQRHNDWFAHGDMYGDAGQEYDQYRSRSMEEDNDRYSSNMGDGQGRYRPGEHM